jgi:hypothetical protein
VFSSYDDAISKCVSIKKHFLPADIDLFSEKHRLFKEIYEKLTPVFSQ